MIKKCRIGIATWPILAALLAVALATGWAQGTGQSTSGREADDAAVKKAITGYTNGWNSKDAHAMTGLLADDVEWVSWNGAVAHGRPMVEAQHSASFSGAYKDTHRTDTVKSIHYLGPDMASVDISWTMTGAKMPDGADWPYRAGYINFLMAKRDGNWVVLISHTADFNAKAPGTTATVTK